MSSNRIHQTCLNYPKWKLIILNLEASEALQGLDNVEIRCVFSIFTIVPHQAQAIKLDGIYGLSYNKGYPIFWGSGSLRHQRVGSDGISHIG